MWFATDIKIIFAIAASVFTIVGYIPYLKDIFGGRTRPHIYTWLIWAITRGTATTALLYGGGDLGSVALFVGTGLVLFVTFLSIRYGTTNITRGDTYALIGALAAIILWWQLDSPTFAVIMVTLIDGIGYVPTLRKSYMDPWSETLSFWLLMTMAALFTLAATATYTMQTVTYVAMLAGANAVLLLVLVWRRKIVDKISR